MLRSVSKKLGKEAKSYELHTPFVFNKKKLLNGDAAVLWSKYLRHDPSAPGWIGRDRFILSAGHGSMLIYSLLHLFNYGLTKEDLQNFRQWGSLTPGHPEYGHTAGVDITTGPLGSGFASAVGMAIAKRRFAAVTGLDKTSFYNPRIFVISGDGCMMEGCSSEAASLAGHLKLDELVVFYDDNTRYTRRRPPRALFLM